MDKRLTSFSGYIRFIIIIVISTIIISLYIFKNWIDWKIYEQYTSVRFISIHRKLTNVYRITAIIYIYYIYKSNDNKYKITAMFYLLIHYNYNK